MVGRKYSQLAPLARLSFLCPFSAPAVLPKLERSSTLWRCIRRISPYLLSKPKCLLRMTGVCSFKLGFSLHSVNNAKANLVSIKINVRWKVQVRILGYTVAQKHMRCSRKGIAVRLVRWRRNPSQSQPGSSRALPAWACHAAMFLSIHQQQQSLFMSNIEPF